MSHLQIIDAFSAEQVAAIEEANTPVDLELATVDKLAAIKQAASESGRLQPIKPFRFQGQEGLAALDYLCGFAPAADGQIPRYWVGSGKDKKGWISTANESNRNPRPNNLAMLDQQFATGHYVLLPDAPWCFDCEGDQGNGGHRAWSARKALVAGIVSHVDAYISVGCAKPKMVLFDRAAPRSKKEINEMEHLISLDLISDLPDALDVSSKLNREVNTVCNHLWLRATGNDIKGSTSRFDRTQTVALINSIEQLPEFMVQVYRGSLDSSGKTAKPVSTFGRPNIAAQLILSANTGNPASFVVNGRSRVWTLPDSIDTPANEITEGFLQVFTRTDSQAPFADVLAGWARAANHSPQRKVGVLNGCIRHYLDTRMQEVVPVGHDETTGQPLPGAEESYVWTCAPCTFAKVDPSKAGKDGWNNFGGLDCGYLGPVKG